MDDNKTHQSLMTTYRTYLDHIRPSESMATNVRLVCKLLEKDVGVKCWHQVTTSALIKWRNMVVSRAKPQTWNTYRRHLRVLINFAMQIGDLSDNPLTVAGLPEPKSKPKTINLDAIRAAVEYLQTADCRVHPAWFWLSAIRILYGTGIRRRQLLALQWSDVLDLEGANARILVAARGSKTRREWIIPLLPACIDALREIRDRTIAISGENRVHSTEQIFNINLWRPNSRYRRAQMDNGQLDAFFRQLNHALKQPLATSWTAPPRFSCHRFRHTFATEFARQGDMRTLQEILGHTNIATTMRYVHPDLERMRSLMGKIVEV